MQWVRVTPSRWALTVLTPEEAPMHTVIVSGFWMDVHTVTNAAFAAFRASRPIVACREVSLVFSSG